jgi:hypothetical protein
MQKFLIFALLLWIVSPLYSQSCEVEIRITSDFPPDEIIDPDVILFGGQKIDSYCVRCKPGKYELVVEHPGFVSVKETIAIPPGDESYMLEKVLISLPRVLEEKISFDVMPGEELPKHKIFFQPVDKKTKEKEIQHGDLIQPGEYFLRIRKQGYDPLEKKWFVWPSPDPIMIREELVAKPVKLFPCVAYDVQPPANLKNCDFLLMDEKEIAFFITKDSPIQSFRCKCCGSQINQISQIKPGRYMFKLIQPGYAQKEEYKVCIVPSEEVYVLKGELVAQPRPIVLKTPFPDVPMPLLYGKVLNLVDNSEITFQDLFPAGKELSLKIQFSSQYKTVVKTVVIEPGEGPYVVDVPLTQLKQYEFFVAANHSFLVPSIRLDEIEYPLEIFVDDKPVETHLIVVEKYFAGRWKYTIWAEFNANLLQIFGGYFFAEKPIYRISPIHFDLIHVGRLVQHLKKIKDPKKIIELMETNLRTSSWIRMLNKCRSKEIEELIAFLESPMMGGESFRIRQKTIIDQLEKLGRK